MLRVLLAQIDTPVGAVTDNLERMREIVVQAREQYRAQVVVFPEHAMSGAPAADLLLREDFLAACSQAAAGLAAAARGITVVAGWPQRQGGRLCSVLGVMQGGCIAQARAKRVLADDPLLDERRWFEPALPAEPLAFELGGLRIGVLAGDEVMTDDGPAGAVARSVDLWLLPDARAFLQGDAARRTQALVRFAQGSGAAVAWVNRTGAQDELVFDGGSQVVDGDGRDHPAARRFEQALLPVELDPHSRRWRCVDWAADEPAEGPAHTWRALVRGIADYAAKNGFERAILGLSGGVDSALVLALAVDALGAANVSAVAMPSRFTAGLSNELARQQTDALGVRLLELPIEPAHQAMLGILAPAFGDREPDLAEENLQSRIRGMLLMALSNKLGGLVLVPGNKSEYAVGYSTIYGDSCGGYAPLKDVWKTGVFELCRWRNAQGDGERIPQAVIDRPPTAELRTGQRDIDSLPPYDVLDELLRCHIEGLQGANQLVAAGFDEPLVRRVLRLVRVAEWKRAQLAPGPRLTVRAFGSARRMPITCGWRGFP